MAQVTISEEHFQELLALAQARGMIPDALADEFIESQITAADQCAFWGEHIHEDLAQAEAEYATQPHRIMNEEEFFAELDAVPYVPKDTPDADL